MHERSLKQKKDLGDSWPLYSESPIDPGRSGLDQSIQPGDTHPSDSAIAADLKISGTVQKENQQISNGYPFQAHIFARR